MAHADRPPNQFLQALNGDDYALIAGELRQEELRRNQVLNDVGEALIAAYLPLNCILSVVTVLEDGSQVETRTIGRESGYGLLHALGAPVAYERMLCQVGGAVLKMPLAALRAAAERRPSLTRMIVGHAQVTHVQIAQSVACNAMHPTAARLARWLLMTHDRLDSDRLPLTQEHLSIMLGVQRTTVNAVAQLLQDEGLISYSRGKVRILDHAGLRRRSCECYTAVERSVDGSLRSGSRVADLSPAPR